MTNPSMDIGELKLCPFCGGGVSLEKADIGRRHDEWFGVVCRNTKNLGGTCCIEQVASRTKEAAITRWNTRANDGMSDLTDGEWAHLNDALQNAIREYCKGKISFAIPDHGLVSVVGNAGREWRKENGK